MGRAEGTGERLPAAMIGAATSMLAERGALLANTTEMPIILDEMTAGLLGAHFDVRSGEDGPLLAGEVRFPDMTRTLLGKPTACVGRDRELATLSSLFNECADEPLGRAVVVVAPTGMGKSRLMHEMTRILRQQRGAGVSIWIGRGDPLCTESAFGVLGHALADECGIRTGEALAERRANLSARVAMAAPASERRRITEFLGELIGAPFQDDESAPLRAARQDAELMNEQMRRAFLDFVASETARRPLLLVLEDLHWGDWPTVRFIDAALRAHSDKPWMVLALARPEVQGRFPKLWEGRDVHQIHLKELSRKASEQLVRQSLGGAAGDSLVERLVNLADGHALYLEELIRAAAERRSEALPETVIAMVQARLQDVDGDARRLLRAASVFGEVFWHSGVAGLAGGATESLLATLVDREIIVRSLDSRFPGEREYAFRHALLREGAYSMLTEADLVLGHRLAAEWLERHGERDAMVLAEHFERGGSPSRAAQFYGDAAAQALRAGDIDAAVASGERGLACGAVAEVREHILATLCEAYSWRFDHRLAAPIAQELLRVSSPGSMAYTTAAKQHMSVALFSGDFTQFAAMVDAVQAVAPSPGAVYLVVMMLLTGATILCLTGQPERGEAYLRKLEALTDGAQGSNPVARGWKHFARALMSLGLSEDPWYSLHEAEASRSCFEEAGDRKGCANAQIIVGMSAWLLGAADRAHRELFEPSAMDPDLPEMAAHRTAIAVDLMLARGEIEAARLDASLLIKHGRAQHYRNEEGLGHYVLARVLHACGDDAAAEREVMLARELIVMPLYRLWPLAVLSEIRRSQGRAAEALDAARQVVLGCESLRNFGYRGAEIRLAYALALEATGAHDEARERIAIARETILRAAARIDDPEMQRGFLHNVPANARTLEVARVWLKAAH
jgi:tetratricopeptide (TPR) repeat protein